MGTNDGSDMKSLLAGYTTVKNMAVDSPLKSKHGHNSNEVLNFDKQFNVNINGDKEYKSTSLTSIKNKTPDEINLNDSFLGIVDENLLDKTSCKMLVVFYASPLLSVKTLIREVGM